MRRPTVNITPAERVGRVLVGLVGVIGGVVLLGSAGGAVIAILEILLILAGLDLIVPAHWATARCTAGSVTSRVR